MINSQKNYAKVYRPADILKKNKVNADEMEKKCSNINENNISKYLEEVKEWLTSHAERFTTTYISLNVLKTDRITDDVYEHIEESTHDHLVLITKILLGDQQNTDIKKNSLEIYMCGNDFMNWCEGKANFNNLSCGSHLLFKRYGEFDWSLYTLLCRMKVT